jgi:hypothetical protein
VARQEGLALLYVPERHLRDVKNLNQLYVASGDLTLKPEHFFCGWSPGHIERNAELWRQYGSRFRENLEAIGFRFSEDASRPA